MNDDNEPAPTVPTQCSNANLTAPENAPTPTTRAEHVTENAQDTECVPDVGGSSNASDGTEFETEVGGSSNAPDGTDYGYNYVGPEGYVSELDEKTEHDSEQSKSDSDESSSEDDTEPPSERVRYDAQLGQGHLMLGMTFGNAKEAREAITKYAVQFGYKLKLNPNEPLRIVAKCQNEKGCPFMLRISKDGKKSWISN